MGPQADAPEGVLSTYIRTSGGNHRAGEVVVKPNHIPETTDAANRPKIA